MNKYRNEKVTVDGINFDSKLEAKINLNLYMEMELQKIQKVLEQKYINLRKRYLNINIQNQKLKK